MIINLTQHAATVDQVASGVADLDSLNKALLSEALTFASVPTLATMQARAKVIASLAVMVGAKKAMIGGAPFFMSVLENTLKAYGVQACYAFSERVSVEKTDEAGNVVKTNVFRHAGFVFVE